MKRFMLGAAMLAALPTVATAQTSYSTGFEASDGFVAGTAPAGITTEGNTVWTQAPNGSTFGQFTTDAAHSGRQSLAILRGQTDNSGVIQGVRGPELSAGAAYGTAITQFTSSVWVRTAQTDTTDPYFMSMNAWSDDRMSWVGMDYNDSQRGLAFYVLDPGADGQFNDDQQLLAGGLTAGAWYRVDELIDMSTPNGSVSYSLYDSSLNLLGSATKLSWAPYYYGIGATPTPINQLNFRTSVDTAGTVAYVDDVSYSVSGAVPEPATWAMMIAGFGLVGGAMRGQRRRGAVTA